MGYITITEIAKEAGVSKSTVSRVLNNKPDVLPETKKRILDLVKKYDFEPSVYAVSMSQKRCNCIGIVVPHDIDYIFKNQYYTEIQRAILKAAQERGFYVLLLCCKEMKEAINAVKQRRVDGLIVLSPMPQHTRALTTFKECNIPFVTIGKCAFAGDVYQLCTDNYKGARIAVEYLLNLGHRHIAYINGPRFLPSSVERLRGYKDALAAAGILEGETVVLEEQNAIEDGYQGALKIMEEHPEVTAIFAASDSMAIGVENAARARGKRIPQDLSVVGFDNIPLSAQVTPALTTIDQHIEEKGRNSVNILLDMLTKKKKIQLKSVDIEPTLCVRESAAAPPELQGGCGR